MELKGKYAVVYVGKALCNFIEKADLTLCSGSINFNFSKFISLNEKNHILANTLLRIIYVYVNVNNLFSDDFSIKTFSDNLFNECFNEQISAHIYYIKERHVIMMDQAVNLKLIPKEMNTFQVIKVHNEQFDSSNLLPKNLNNLFNSNSYPLRIKFIDNDDEGVYISPDEISQLTNQNYLIHDIFITLRNTLSCSIRLKNCDRLRLGLPTIKIDNIEKVNLVEFIQTAIKLEKDLIIKELRKDENINLLYAIIKSDVDLMFDCLKIINPRCHNNEYYFVALKIGNEEITKIIRDIIIMNIWLEKQLFITKFESLIGTTNSYLDITQHMQNNLYMNYF